MNPRILAAFLIVISPYAEAEEKIVDLVVADDGFPAGNTTPEGAACDLVRAFALSDVELLKKTCLPTYGGGEIAERYNTFLKKIITGTVEDKAAKTPHPKNPKAIGKVFAARFLTKNGPASYGYAIHGFEDVMFVDIGAFLHDESRFLNRTMVVREDGVWRVHPCPTIDSLLSAGLNEESESTIDYKGKDGADQPATVPESKPEGKEKPKPKAEERPQ